MSPFMVLRVGKMPYLRGSVIISTATSGAPSLRHMLTTTLATLSLTRLGLRRYLHAHHTHNMLPNFLQEEKVVSVPLPFYLLPNCVNTMLRYSSVSLSLVAVLTHSQMQKVLDTVQLARFSVIAGDVDVCGLHILVIFQTFLKILQEQI